VKFRFIADHQTEFPVGLMCHLLKVARSSYYAYCKHPTKELSAQEGANKVLLGKIKVIFEQSKRRYGSPRVHRKLHQQVQL
jgi:putative transposase